MAAVRASSRDLLVVKQFPPLWCVPGRVVAHELRACRVRRSSGILAACSAQEAELSFCQKLVYPLDSKSVLKNAGVGDVESPVMVLVDPAHLPCTSVVKFGQCFDVFLSNCPCFTAPE